MPPLIPLKKKSQYDRDINPAYRNSACGPVTAYAILQYHFPQQVHNINLLYKKLGGTRIGLFTWRFIRNLTKMLGSNWCIEKCSVEEMKQQIDKGNPVAAKFDKWFSCQWRGHFSFHYHWVPIVGYLEKEDGLWLYIHDHGGRNRPSKLQLLPYTANQKILTFVKIEKKKEAH